MGSARVSHSGLLKDKEGQSGSFNRERAREVTDRAPDDGGIRQEK